jgi:hypothetical protein
MKISKCIQLLGMFALIVVSVLGLLQARALAGVGITPPDLSVCDTVEQACDAQMSVCKGGYRVTLEDFMPAAPMDSGMATFIYTICSPALGTCDSGPLPTDTVCEDNNDCSPMCNKGQGKCQDTDVPCTMDSQCVGTCSRDCAVDDFNPLNTFDIGFPILARDVSCLDEDTIPMGACECIPKDPEQSPPTCSVTSTLATGDPTCFPNTCEGVVKCSSVGMGVKKCEGTDIVCTSDPDICDPGHCSDTGGECRTNGECPNAHVASCTVSDIGTEDCIQMTLQIGGEMVDELGTGPIVTADKETNECSSACIAGPSCYGCEPTPAGEQCITRTLGFWGTHPWITNDYVPVTVCGESLTCDGLATGDDPKSTPVCEYGHCNDVMEGLGSIGGELKTNAPYVAMIKQLTAAKLNLSATEDEFDASCSSFCCDLSTGNQVWADDGECPAGSQSIQDVITTCEGLCDASKKDISGSGCIECLDAFNKSKDVIDDSTPSPFSKPPVDDSGNISGADPSYFTGAQNNKTVIGKDIGGGEQCAP